MHGNLPRGAFSPNRASDRLMNANGENIQPSKKTFAQLILFQITGETSAQDSRHDRDHEVAGLEDGVRHG